ncbi:amino acid/amide ABC transporter ATP-binding protein 2, HAAT family [Bradyrhizobium brasilense]|uniref:Amino acid/amide ABC transporter ATP-binding protein 2, HAAT family n=1 Tax=Bradyrhizobium brasilense TaxID=1419277 RepID=A0A1G7Q9K9_9BRAD|nr:ABC transporter ATP-binding protein [Bradyrhizobium brasilense]SDF94270.1 amino acid/amide ABC transporter ATP-binding protein 2, HAAT family [Bradyrhizobium brasilense]
MLEVERIEAGYGSVKVLRDVSFSLKPREILVLLGRNGVGKTTLMQALIGLLPLSAGRILLDGTDLTGAAPHVIARNGIGYVPQGRGIFPKLTVRENLLVGTRARGGSAVGIPDSVLEFFPILKDRLAQLGGTLSGGQQQMLAIARALCGDPKVILLDEPSEGIQPNIVFQIGETIRRLVTQTDLTVLLVEQNLDLGLRAATRCMIMEKGSIVRMGVPDEFRDEAVLREYLAI